LRTAKQVTQQNVKPPNSSMVPNFENMSASNQLL